MLSSLKTKPGLWTCDPILRTCHKCCIICQLFLAAFHSLGLVKVLVISNQDLSLPVPSCPRFSSRCPCSSPTLLLRLLPDLLFLVVCFCFFQLMVYDLCSLLPCSCTTFSSCSPTDFLTSSFISSSGAWPLYCCLQLYYFSNISYLGSFLTFTSDLPRVSHIYSHIY